MKKVITLLFISGLLCGTAPAESLTLSVDKEKVVLGDGIYLSLNFEGAQDLPAPDLGTVDGFSSSRYLGPSSNLTIINGKSSASVSHAYLLAAVKTGTFNIGPFTVDYKDKQYTSNAITIEVVDKPASPANVNNREGEESRAEAKNIGDKIFLVIQPEKRKVYINEKFNLSIKLYVKDLDIRLSRGGVPQISHDGFSLAQFSQPRQYKDMLNGVYYDVVDFSVETFAVKSGELSLGPANFECYLMVKPERQRRLPSFGAFDGLIDDSLFEDFFGAARTQPLNLDAAGVGVVVSPLPEENKPANFNGAIGGFNLDAQAGPPEVSVGDPITLRLAVSGKGNFDTVTTPGLGLSENDFKVYEPRITNGENSKIFEYVVMPKTEKVTAIPGISFSFFNTADGRYSTIEKGPFPITVSKGRAETQKIVEQNPATQKTTVTQVLGRDIIYIKDLAGALRKKGHYLFKNRIFWLLQFLPLLCFVIVSLINKHYRRLMVDDAYAKKLKAPSVAAKGLKTAAAFLSDSKSREFYETLFKTLQQYLGYKLRLPWRGITVDIAGLLESKGWDKEIIDSLKHIFGQCDMARFSSQQFEPASMKEDLKTVKKIIDYSERRLK
jgi:hypothetical protein